MLYFDRIDVSQGTDVVKQANQKSVMLKKMLKKIRSLCIFLSKMSAFRRNFDETKYISFLIKYEELLEKYNEI